MHLDSILRHDELSEVLNSELFKSEEAHVREDRVKHLIVAIGADRVQLIKLLNEHFQEVLITNAAVEHLLDEDLLVGILDGREEVVGVRVNRVDDRVERLDALLALLKQLSKLHFAFGKLR